MSSVGGTSVGAPGGTFAPPALTNGIPFGILKCEAYACHAAQVMMSASLLTIIIYLGGHGWGTKSEMTPAHACQHSSLTGPQVDKVTNQHGQESCASLTASHSTTCYSSVGRTACLRIEIAGRKLAADCDPSRADVAVLAEQLQPSSPCRSGSNGEQGALASPCPPLVTETPAAALRSPAETPARGLPWWHNRGLGGKGNVTKHGCYAKEL